MWQWCLDVTPELGKEDDLSHISRNTCAPESVKSERQLTEWEEVSVHGSQSSDWTIYKEL